MFGKVENDISLEMKCPRRDSVMYTLDSEGNFAQYSHFEASITKFLTLEISHLETCVSHQVVINERSCRSRQMGRHQAWERSPLHAEDIFFLLIGVTVARSGL